MELNLRTLLSSFYLDWNNSVIPVLVTLRYDSFGLFDVAFVHV